MDKIFVTVPLCWSSQQGLIPVLGNNKLPSKSRKTFNHPSWGTEYDGEYNSYILRRVALFAFVQSRKTVYGSRSMTARDD